jgi:hypothetical protein
VKQLQSSLLNGAAALSCFFLLSCSPFGPLVVPRVITTIAGNGTQGYSGDNGPATSAELSNPAGIALDASGNLYIADTGNNRVRKVSVNGTITTVAGTGVSGFSGDTGPAISAKLNSPSAVAVDAAGNLYIADGANYRVRKVTFPAGTINTVAGNGTAGFTGDNGAPGSATSAELNWLPGYASLAVDSSGVIYISDQNNDRIRKVDTAGVITTIAGGGTASIYGIGTAGIPATSVAINPGPVALDAGGDVFFGAGGGLGLEVSPSGNMTVILSEASTGTIHGISVDGNGSVYSETYCKVFKGTTQIEGPNGNATPGFSGDNGPATSAQIQGASANGVLAADSSGAVYLADQGNNRIRKLYSTSSYAP